MCWLRVSHFNAVPVSSYRRFNVVLTRFCPWELYIFKYCGSGSAFGSGSVGSKIFIYTFLLLHDCLSLKNDVNLPVFFGLSDPHVDPLARGMDPRIRIRSRIRCWIHTVPKGLGFATLVNFFHCRLLADSPGVPPGSAAGWCADREAHDSRCCTQVI